MLLIRVPIGPINMRILYSSISIFLMLAPLTVFSAEGGVSWDPEHFEGHPSDFFYDAYDSVREKERLIDYYRKDEVDAE